MTTYLHQVIAAQRGADEEAKRDLASVQQILAAGGDQSPLTGLTRTHEPKMQPDSAEAYDRQPDQLRQVQMTSAQLIAQVAASQARLTDVKLTRETGNTQARASVAIDGQVLLEDVPTTFLLGLEEQLKGLVTGLVDRLQVLDPAEEWRSGPEFGEGIRASVPRSRLSKEKQLVCHVGVQPTEHQPAVVVWRDEDVVTGTLTFTKFSGQLPLEQVQEIRQRLTRLIEAIRAAREEANRLEVDQLKVGAGINRYVFGALAG